MRQGVFPKRKSKLSAQGKAIAAARGLIAVAEGAMDEKQVGAFLREAVGLNWSLLTAIQYLTGQEAINAVEALPAGWFEDGMDKQRVVAAMTMAHDMAANLHPKASLSAGLFVKHFKREAGK
jgi:hypothetical protein